ncbi:hypothetical protein GSI_01650 [Ganoderma sinense ZZ0214-1]|uniref:Uncharacterized protein n=1 Tax=Ganoderma sinense ZZ0214-1 TaxID=1077348 RepID=A0A2G8SQF6_9APHY|nr:hypothetical protein GSI_01650 [Ganoderma sinense ZZ0214-1]
MDCASLLVWPGFSETVVVVIKPPKGLNLTGNPVLFGFLEIANADESYHVTYLGLAAALKGTHVDNTDTFFGVQIPAIFHLNSNVVNTTHNFTFQGTDFPSIMSRLDFGTPLFRFDLVQPVTTSLSSRDGVHVFERWAYTFPRDKKPNTLVKFAKRTKIANFGAYRILLRALKGTGDLTREEDSRAG